MTVIVWDGETLATDGAATDGACQWETEKAWYAHNAFGQYIISGAGPLQTILQMRQWYISGAHPDEFPEAQTTLAFCQFVVVNSDGLRRWEQGAIPIEHQRLKCAFGEGKEFAYGAMAMGATAAQAVEVANKFSPHCGLGVHEYRLGGTSCDR